jgi:hypothetical protein
MRQILIELHTPGESQGDFLILEHPTFGEDDFYPQAVSYSWFHDRELKRAFPDVSSGKLIDGMNWVEYASTIKYCSEHTTYRGIKEHLDFFGIDINTVPVCKGVWDFYNKIGYDRKRKKYL